MTAEHAATMTREQKLEADQFQADVEILSRTPAGQRFLAWIVREGHVLSTCYTGNMVGTFMQGEQNLALKVLGAVRAFCPDVVPLILPPVPDPKQLKTVQADSNLTAIL